MVAFTAEYAGGEIAVDPAGDHGRRLVCRRRLPEIPPPISVARRLIDWFEKEFSSNREPE